MTDTTNAVADPAIDPAIAALAETLAGAELDAEAATSAHREAEALRDTVRARVQALEAARREIGSRRAAGDQRASDGADLELIALDREGLLGILAQRDADVAAARAEAERQGRTLDQARHDLARAEAERTAAALTLRLKELAGLLLETIRQANDTARRLHRGQTEWRPSPDLMGALVPLEAARWRS